MVRLERLVIFFVVLLLCAQYRITAWSGARGRQALRSQRQATTFGTQEYWEKFYSGDSADSKDFEWFCDYEDIRPFFHEFAQPVLDASSSRPPKMLVAGCGNSHLTCDLYDDLCADSMAVEIWNVDYAEAAITRARATAGRRKLRHVVADLRALPEETFREKSFDVVVDKGTMDALFCAGPSSVQRFTAELRRVLRPGGMVLLMSGVATGEEILEIFRNWTTVLDGSPYITEEGEASINLRSRLFVFLRPRDDDDTG